MDGFSRSRGCLDWLSFHARGLSGRHEKIKLVGLDSEYEDFLTPNIDITELSEERKSAALSAFVLLFAFQAQPKSIEALYDFFEKNMFKARISSGETLVVYRWPENVLGPCGVEEISGRLLRSFEELQDCLRVLPQSLVPNGTYCSLNASSNEMWSYLMSYALQALVLYRTGRNDVAPEEFLSVRRFEANGMVYAHMPRAAYANLFSLEERFHPFAGVGDARIGSLPPFPIRSMQ